MNVDNDVKTDRADKPLTRADIEQRLQRARSSSKLDVHGQNLHMIDLSETILNGANFSEAILIRADLSKALCTKANFRGAVLNEANLSESILTGANLSYANLSKAYLGGADLSGADLSGANLSEADLSGAILIGTTLKGTILRGADVSGAFIDTENKENILSAMAMGIRWGTLKKASLRTRDINSFSIRITEEPLTAQNTTTILTTLTDLHTRCWLLAQGRLSDAIAYGQTKTPRFIEEAHLVVEKINHNSPAEFKFNLNADASPQGLAEALGTAIDAVSQVPHRWQAAKLENQLKELEVKKQELETQTFLAEKEQARQLEAQQADLERQKTLLDIAKQQVELQKTRWEFETQRLNYALETAKKMMELLQPGIDDQTRTMLVQTLLPSLLQLGESKGLELVLPPPTNHEPGKH